MLRIATVFGVAAFSSTLFAPAQVAVIQLVAPPAMNGSCPIEFSAQRSGGPTKMVVDSGTRLPVSQQVVLHFGNTTRHNIAQVSVTVHGLTGNARVMPVVMDESGPATRSTHAELKLAIAALGHAATSLSVSGITSIRTIDLDSVLYDDGSEWQASTGKPCTIVPNGFMLVDGK